MDSSFFFFLPPSPIVDQRVTTQNSSRDRGGVAKRSPEGHCPCAHVCTGQSPVGKRERSECGGGKGGIPSLVARARTCARTSHHTLAFRVAPRPPLSVRWCGKSVVLTGTRWSTTLKAVVAVKEEGRRAGAGVQGEAGSRWRGGGG